MITFHFYNQYNRVELSMKCQVSERELVRHHSSLAHSKCTLTLIHSYTHSHSYVYTHTYSNSYTHSHSLSHSYTHPHSLLRIYIYTHTLSHSLSYTHFLIHSLTLGPTHLLITYRNINQRRTNLNQTST